MSPTNDYTVKEAARTVLETFQRDEADGFRSMDRQFAIALLKRAFESASASDARPSGPDGSQRTKTGAELIADERTRQVNAEGWTAFHDDSQHYSGELVSAAICYAEAGSGFDLEISPRDGKRPTLWPWEPSSWKPSDDLVRNLVKAGALIAAEIDRVQREDNPDVIAEIPMPGSPQEPTGAPPTASDGSQAIGSATQAEIDRLNACVGDLLQSVGARESEARQAREAMQSLDVFYVAERERLTASLTALRGACETLSATWARRALALTSDREVMRDDRIKARILTECTNELSTALAVSRAPTETP